MPPVYDSQTLVQLHAITPANQKQWETVSTILDATPSFAQDVWNDLHRNQKEVAPQHAGAKGWSADQVLRFALVKTIEGRDYRALAMRVDDAIVLREFCRIPFDKIPAFTTLQDNIKKIRPETLRRLNDGLMCYAVRNGVEDAPRVRMDSTAIEANIHHPIDARQLWDGVRVLTRILTRAQEEIERLRGRFHDHTRVAQRLLYKITNARGDASRKPLYKRLIAVAQKTVAYAQTAIEHLAPERCEAGCEELLLASEVSQQLQDVLGLTQRVIDQTQRRVVRGEAVPAQDKVVSLFEPHADIIVKGQREVIFGPKIFLTNGVSNLILDCVVPKGNPADADMFPVLLERHQAIFATAPRDLATDGGFASKRNGQTAQQDAVKNVAFSTPKGLRIEELVQSLGMFKCLRNGRAGVEAILSTAKRAYGWTRCNWRGFESFQAYVYRAVLAYHLKTLATITNT